MNRKSISDAHWVLIEEFLKAARCTCARCGGIIPVADSKPFFKNKNNQDYSAGNLVFQCQSCDKTIPQILTQGEKKQRETIYTLYRERDTMKLETDLVDFPEFCREVGFVEE